MTRTGPLRVILIGAGDIATSQHLPAIAHAGDQVVVVADPVPERAQLAARRFGIPRAVSTSEEAFGVPADVAVITTPPHVAPALIRSAIDVGLDVLCEKPMALSLDAAAVAVRAARHSTRSVQVGYKNRFHPLMRRLHDAIVEGSFGTPVLLRLSIFDETWRPDDRVHTERIAGFLGQGSAYVHNGVHLTDFMAWSLGDPDWVMGAGHRVREEATTPTYLAAVYGFADDSVARLEVGWWYPGIWESEFQVYGPRAVADLSRRDGTLVVDRGDGAPRTYVESADWQTVCFRGQWDAFRRTVGTGQPGGAGVDDACRALGLAIAAADAAEREARVTMPVAGWGGALP